MSTIPTEFPTQFPAGTTVVCRVEFPDCPADDGWSLKTLLNGGDPQDPQRLSSDATADGSGFLITLSAEDTSDLTAGRYGRVLRATKDGVVRDVETGIVTVSIDFESADAGAALSHAERTLASVRATIRSRVETDQAQYEILGRGAKREDLDALRRLEGDLVAEIASRRRGGAPREPHRIAFRRPRG